MKNAPLSVLLLVAIAACGGDDDGGGGSPVDAGNLADAEPVEADAADGLAGAYARVIPGYETEEACRAENPDELFACVELVSLCAGDRAFILFTDIVFDAAWTEDAGSATLTFETYDAAFSDDGTTVFVEQEDGSIASDEVYGDRPFDRSSREPDSLCP
ncbi:MAG TPA: hypothetical protein VFU21_05250 [Kofleriaceae bacterium]|nr:hypothetical protein [Kofleriaceae bacterium]